MKITSISAEKILDSRGEWTTKAVVELEDGSKGYGEVPSGASRGEKEAALLPVEQAVSNISSKIVPELLGKDASDQQTVDSTLLSLDGTQNKGNLGANALLAVSLGVCEAAAASQKTPLYKYISQKFGFTLLKDNFPTPIFNIINGGAHAGGTLDIQEFMIAPATHKKFSEALEMGVAIYHSLEKMLSSTGLSTEVGDEGGFAPNGLNTFSACDYLLEAGKSAGFSAGSDFFIAMDIAANSFSEGKVYSFKERSSIKNGRDFLDFYRDLTNTYPVIYLEDPYNEEDLDSWALIRSSLGDKVDIIGDDLTVTNSRFLDVAIKKELITGVIVKPNQIGTLTETIDFVRKAQANNLVVTVSHRSGETGEDTFISDLAVAVGARYIKAGAPARGERVVKYNRLLDIYTEISAN